MHLCAHAEAQSQCIREIPSCTTQVSSPVVASFCSIIMLACGLLMTLLNLSFTVSFTVQAALTTGVQSLNMQYDAAFPTLKDLFDYLL